jgi:hypothetical protein
MQEPGRPFPDQGAWPVAPMRGVSARAVILGLLLIVPNVWWIITVEGIWHSSHCTAVSLFWNVVFTVLILLLVNIPLKRFAPRWAFSQAELLTVYSMVAVASALAGHDTLQLGIPNLSYPFYFANEGNRWEEVFWPNIADWLSVRDHRTVFALHEGHSSLYIAGHWRAWVTPVLMWTAFITVVCLVMLAINFAVRRQWTEHEKLGYPIIQLPLQMTRNGGNRALFGNGYFWVGFAFAAALDAYNGLHSFWPQVPVIDVRHDGLHRIETGSWGLPWSALGTIWLPWYPFIIGLGMLLPLDLCFSIWFFYLFRMAQRVAFAIFPFSEVNASDAASAQSFGAWFAYFGLSLYAGRRYWRDMAAGIWRSRSRLRTSGYRPEFVALALALAGSVALWLFLVAAGMRAWVAGCYLLIVFVIHTAITRMRAELGPPAHEMAGNMNAPAFLVNAAGVPALGKVAMSLFPMMWWLSGRGYRTTPMPVQLEGLKLAQDSGGQVAKVAQAMAVAAVLGTLVAFWSFLHQTYQVGHNPMIGHNGQWSMFASWIGAEQEPSWKWMSYVGAGALFTVGLSLLRTYFVWFPLHPAGYALSMNFGVEYFWTCLVIAWAIKWLLLRYAGHRLYQKVLPIAYGVILGEFAVGAFWSALGVILGRPLYDFCPG